MAVAKPRPKAAGGGKALSFGLALPQHGPPLAEVSFPL